jgi:signal transduction histidine kinase/DNA-binding response OmpR family regulator
MLPDASGHLWCSTNRGIFRLTMHDEAVADVKVFTQADGLQNNEFNTQAFFKTSDGMMLFGGVDGFNRFSPELLELNKHKPPVHIVGLEINHQPARFSPFDGILPNAPEYLREITLGPDQNNLSFEFAALDFTDPAKNHYQYQLLPLEKDWVKADDKHFAHYTHLAPGTYIFRVKASNNDGAWNDNVVEMKVIVLPPWWKTPLAIFLYFVLALFIGWLVYREHIRSIRLKAQVAFEQRERERIRALEQMKTNFFSNVAHEFRTPLTLIIEPLRQILKKPDEPDWLPKIGMAARNSQKLLHLVNELLDLAKLESGAMKPEYRTGMLGDILRPVVESFTAIAESRDIDLQLILQTDVKGHFDSDKLEKICFNLLSNALKFTPAGGQVRVIAEAVVSEMDSRNNTLRLTVQDNGKGISAAELPHVFERFYQAQEISETGQTGTGIGLALCRELAELMEGRISVESEPGKGASFRVELPLRQHPQDPETSHVKNTGPSAPAPALLEIRNEAAFQPHPAGRPLLLLAEDNEELRAFLYQTLSETCEVIEAPDGKKAIELARQRVPDIVVSDIFMPHVDGIELLDLLKKDVVTSHIPVLLLTSKTALENRLEGLQHGADAYLGKPFQTEELLAWINNLLQTRRRLQERFARPPSTDHRPGHPEMAEAEEPSAAAALSALDRRFLEKLHQIAEQEIENEHFSVEELARQMTMSRSQLHRKMAAITGLSAGEFLRNFRLDRAMELLRDKAGNVSEISWRVGFSNSKYFSTSFKERFGVSPSEV